MESESESEIFFHLSESELGLQPWKLQRRSRNFLKYRFINHVSVTLFRNQNTSVDAKFPNFRPLVVVETLLKYFLFLNWEKKIL